jgi:hypothetical protein
MNAYLADWEGRGFEALAEDFGLHGHEREELEAGFEVLHAYYSYENYSGEAFVILRSRADGSLWEVNGSHCSCHGLDGQWDLEPTAIEALLVRHAARELPGLDAQGGHWIEALMESHALSDEIGCAHAPSARQQAL